MTWKLFLDDERFPCELGWTICRTVEEAINQVILLGPPTHMSLDHDLGENQKTGYEFVKEYVNIVFNIFNLVKDFGYLEVDFYVHSQNPIGKKNMEEYWNNFQNFQNVLWSKKE